MASTKKKNTTKKEEEEKKETSSTSKKSTKKKTSSQKSGSNKKKTSSSQVSAGSTKKKKPGRPPKKNSSSQSSKVKVRVTHEEVSGIEEGMEESEKVKNTSTNKKGSGGKGAASSKKGKSGTKEDSKKEAKKSDADKEPQEETKEDVDENGYDYDTDIQETADEVSGEEEDLEDKTDQEGDEQEKEDTSESEGEWDSFAIEDEDPPKKKKKVKPKTISLYKKIAFTFILLTLLLLGAVVYFSIVQVEIVLTPEKERVSNNLFVDVYNKQDSDKNISSSSALGGVVDQLEITKKKTYESTGEEVTGKEIVGEVKIINNYSESQPLVASTRLLSPNDKLFRIDRTVRVAPGESVTVDIYTEEPGPEMAIGPTEFTIPGLWAGLQEDIYAKSVKGFEYRTEKKVFIKEYDVNNAVRDIKEELSKDAKKRFGENYLGYDEVIYEKGPIDVKVKGEVGDEKEEFEVMATGKINVVAFDREKLADMARAKLTSLVSEDKKLVELNRENMDYSVSNYNFQDKVITLKVNFDGKTILKNDADIVDKKKIVGLNEQQLKDYLDGLEKISDYKIRFSPSFVDEVPSLVDRIDIKIEEQ